RSPEPGGDECTRVHGPGSGCVDGGQARVTRVAGQWGGVKRVGEGVGAEQVEGGDVAEGVENRGCSPRGGESVHVGDAQAGVEQGGKRGMRAGDEEAEHRGTNPDPLSDGEDAGESVFGIANAEGADSPGFRIPDEARAAALDNRKADGMFVAL